MILPDPETLRAMRGRDVLKLAAEWFEAEGRRTTGSIEAAEEVYGADCVGPEMRTRAGASFALATLCDTVRANAERSDARKQDGAFASLLASTLRAAFLTPSTPAAVKVSPDAAEPQATKSAA